MPISWEHYTKRRGLNIVAWLRGKKIQTYADLEAECKKRSISPPKHDAVKDLLAAANNPAPPKSKSIPPKPKPKPRQVPKRKPEPKPTPKQPVKVPPVRKKPEPKKSPAPMIKPFIAEVASKPEAKEAKSTLEPAPTPIVKEPEKSKKIIWNFMMKKSQLLELAQSVNIEGLSSKSTKAQIVGSLVKAGHPESQA